LPDIIFDNLSLYWASRFTDLRCGGLSRNIFHFTANVYCKQNFFCHKTLTGTDLLSQMYETHRYRKRPRLWFYNLQVRAFSYHLNGAICARTSSTRQRAEQNISLQIAKAYCFFQVNKSVEIIVISGLIVFRSRKRHALKCIVLNIF